MAGRFSVEAVFKAVDRVTAPVSRMQNRVGKFTRSMNKGINKLNRNVDKLAGGIKKAGLAIVASLALTGAAMGDVIMTGAEFEQTLVAAAAKFPGEISKGTEAFRLLEDAARKTGATTEFTASQSAEALNFLAMAGFNAQQSVAALPGVVDLATAANIDLATATDVATDSLGAFGLMTNDAAQLGTNLARVNDVIAKTTTSANTTVEAMFETIKQAGPVAVSAGASIETFAALTGELANAGIKGSQAGTTLKNMFLKLAAPSTKGGKLLKRFGVATQDANGDMRDITDILGDLNKGLDGLGTAEKAGVLEGIFGKIPIAGVNVLLKSGTKRLKEYREQLEAASGASSKMAGTMRDTLQGRLNSLNSAIEGVKISIFTMTSGPLADTVDKMTEWVRTNEKLIATNIGEFLLSIINNLENIVTWAKRIGIALGVFITFTTILKTVVLVMTVFNLLVAMNPLGLMVLGVAALIAGFTALVVWIDDISAGFDSLPGIVQLILAPIGLLIEAIKFVKDNIGVLSDAASAVSGFADAGINKVSETAGNVASFLGFGDDEDEVAPGATGPQIVSPQERVARSIEEQRKTNTSEITLKTEPGTSAEVTGGSLGGGLKLQPSGAF